MPLRYPRPFPKTAPKRKPLVLGGDFGAVLIGSTIIITLPRAATVYWLIKASGTQMTAADISAGTGGTLTGNFEAGAGSTVQVIDLSSLAVGDWYLHIAADYASATDDAAAPIGFHITPRVTIGTITPSSSGASVAWSTTGGNGTAYWLVSANATETDAAVKAGTSVAISASGSQTALAPSGLSASTTYYIHILHTDGDGRDGARVSQSFTTTAAASLAFVQQWASADYTFNTSCDITLTGTVTAGNRLFAFVAWGGDRTRTPPSGWTEVAYIAASSDGGGLGLYQKTTTAAGTEGGTTLSWTSSASVKVAIAVFEVSGATGSIEYATQNASRDPSAITPSAGSGTYLTLVADAYKGVYNSGGTHAFTAAPSGYSNFQYVESESATSSSAGDRTLATATKVWTGTTENPGTFSVYGPWVDPQCYQTITAAIW
jgi:hypothetical protein